MSNQTCMFDRETMWVLGAAEACVMGRGRCRFQPCTVAQGVRCCAACRFGCVSMCGKAGKERKES